VAGAVTNCIFTENSARSYGGGFYANTFENDITNCDFISNAAAGGGYGGGGFCLNYMTGSVEACTFTGNSAGSYGGGGFSVTQSLTGDINDCSFSTNCGEYGGVHVRGSLIGDITGCEFLENSSGSEGAVIGVVFNAFDGKIENCRFLGHEGTAVALGYDCNTPATIRNCLFAAPATLGEVQGWAVRTSQLTTISNNTMVGPGLGMVGPIGLPSAIYIEFDTEAEAGSITNNIITDTGCAIHVDAGMDMPINYNCFYNVADTVCQGEQPLSNECWWLEHLLDNFRDNCCNCDPLFCPDDPIYHIQGSSPCVDAGSPAYAPEAGETDIDGQERIRYGYRTPAVDIGADEYYPLDADLYNDGIVNFVDFAILLTYWQQNEPSADIAPPGGDGIVDFLDLAKLCEDWLRSCSSIGL